jgi:hypothetical protein
LENDREAPSGASAGGLPLIADPLVAPAHKGGGRQTAFSAVAPTTPARPSIAPALLLLLLLLLAAPTKHLPALEA